MARPGRLWRVARLALKILAITLLGLAGLVLLVLVSLDLPPVRGFIVKQANSALGESFRGKLVLREIGLIDLRGVKDVDLEVLDPKGATVLRVDNADVALAWPGLVYDAIAGADPLVIEITGVEVDDLRVHLIDDGTGSPTLAKAFEPREKKPEDPAAAETVVIVEDVVVHAARVHGALKSPGPIDVGLKELHASLKTDSTATAIVLERVDLDAKRLPQVERVSGRLTAQAYLPAEPKPAPSARSTPATAAPPAPNTPEMRLKARFNGDAAGSGIVLDAALDGKKVNGSVAIGSLAPATVAKLSGGGVTPTDPASVSAKVEGTLDDLGFEAHVSQSPARIDVDGRLRTVDGGSSIEARLAAREVDASRLAKGSPATRIALDGQATLRLDDAGGRGNYRLVLSPESRFEAYGLPETTVEGELGLPKEEPPQLSGTVRIDEPGAPTRIEYDVRAEPAGLVAQVSSNTRLADPPRVKALSGGLTTSGTLDVTARFDAAARQLDADVGVRLGQVRHPAVRARSLNAKLTAHGDPSAPNLKATADLTQVTAAERVLERVRLSAEGTPEQLDVRAEIDGRRPDRVELRTRVAPSQKQLLTATTIDIEDRNTRVRVRVASVSVEPGRIGVERLTLEGPGRAEASLVYGRTLERLELVAEKLEPVPLLRALGIESPLESAQIDLDARYVGRGQQAQGKLEGALTRVKLGRLEGASARFDVELERGKLTGELGAELGAGASAKLRLSQLDLPLPPFTQQKLRGLTGDVMLEGNVDLGRLRPIFPVAGIERADGKIRFDVALERSGKRVHSPQLRADIQTARLIVVQQRPDAGKTKDPKQAERAEPLTLRGIDFHVRARLDDAGAGVNARVYDLTGDLLAVHAEWKGISPERDLFRPLPALMQSPFTLETRVPPRALDRLPAAIRPKEFRGTLALEVDAKGTLQDPEVKAQATLIRFGPATEREDRRGLDIMLDAEYAPRGGMVWLRADGRKRSVVALDTKWQGNLADLGQAKDGNSPIKADLALALDEFPLAVIPVLRDRQIRGRLSGHARLQGLGEDAKFELALESRKLRVERVTLEQLAAKVRTVGDRLELEADIQGAGRAGAKVTTGIDWGARLVPVLDQTVEGRVFAKDLRLATLQPAVAGAVSELDGKLDADLRAKLAGGKPEIQGSIQLTEGVMHLPSLGQRFHDIGAKVRIAPGSLRLEELVGGAESGRFRATAQAKLDGLTPAAMDAELHIRESEKLPLTMEGETVGDVWGTIEARYRSQAAAKTTQIDVNVKRLTVELPEVTPHGVQGLGEAEHIKVGFRRNDGQFAEIPLQPIEEPKEPSDTKTTVTVHLGTIHIEKGQQIDVTLGGKLRAIMGGENLDVKGAIEMRSGKLDISGKQFEVERGVVTFTGGEPDNPTISAVARYESGAGYIVYAEYTGTAKVGSLRLRAEPPLSQDEILTLLLFGTPEGSFGAGSGDSLSTAVSVAGGTAAKGLNRALSDVTDLEVSARIDTSTGAPRPELVVQLSPRVSARVTQALGEPSPGQSPDRTFFTVEFRFARAWSLSTTVGDRGASAFDVIWRKRY